MERLNKLSEDLAEKKAILNSKIEEVRAGAEDDATDVADVQAGMEEVKQLKAEIETLSAQIETLNEALGLEPEADTEAPAEDGKEPAEDATEPEDKRDGEDIEIQTTQKKHVQERTLQTWKQLLESKTQHLRTF